LNILYLPLKVWTAPLIDLEDCWKRKETCIRSS